MSALASRVAQMEQHARDCNIEVQCVPESRSKTLLTISYQLSHTVSYELPDMSICGIYRVAKLKPNSNRPRSIFVRMMTPPRDSVLSFNKSNNGMEYKLNALHLGFVNNKQAIFVSEHLTLANKQLGRKATFICLDPQRSHLHP